MIDSRFQKLNFNEHKFVIEALQFLQQTVNESKGIVVGLFDHIKGDKTGF